MKLEALGRADLQPPQVEPEWRGPREAPRGPERGYQRLGADTRLPCDISAGLNVERITPPWLSFSVLSSGPTTMPEGTLIEYRLRHHGAPLRWRSRISAWGLPRRFVDEQVRGSLTSCVHEHTFVKSGSSTICSDLVRYAVPGGRLVDWLFV